MRTDIHRPSKIIPEDYEYVGCRYYGDGMADWNFLRSEIDHIRKHMNETGGKYSSHEHGGSCFICGAHANNLAVYYHRKSNTYIQCGEICADNLQMADNELNLFKLKVRAELDLAKGKAATKKWLSEIGLAEAWDFQDHELLYDPITGHLDAKCNDLLDKGWNGADADFFLKKKRILTDLIEKHVKYGNLSEKQIAFLRKLTTEILNFDRIRVEREKKRKTTAPCPSGRQEITGKILCFKQVEQSYSYDSVDLVTKIVLLVDTGYKVYGTLPGSIHNAEIGNKIRLMATLQPSKDDPTFGFYKRPAKAKIL